MEEAQSQLSFRYLHLGGWTAGILDFMLMQFRIASEKKDIKFLEWIEKDYDVPKLTNSYKTDEKLDILNKIR